MVTVDLEEDLTSYVCSSMLREFVLLWKNLHTRTSWIKKTDGTPLSNKETLYRKDFQAHQNF